jgi:hypothetical protein
MNPLFLLAALAAVVLPAAAENVSAIWDGKQIVVRTGDKEILRYKNQSEDLPRKDIKEIFKRGGYIQSIYTPSGKLVIDDFPPNHLHHHGVWSAWTKTEFEGRTPDFWNMGDGKGRVDFLMFDRVWDEEGRGRFKVGHKFVDMTVKPEKTALYEKWDVTVSSADKQYLIDMTITQTCATNSPLKLPEYHYGGLGFRGNRAWDGAANCKFLTASGLTDRLKVNTAKEPWCWVGGKVDGGTCGVAIFCHLSNFRAPQPIRVHPTEPFFCYAPQQGGMMAIEPGKPYVARYRLVVADGEPDKAALDKLATEYAAVK